MTLREFTDERGVLWRVWDIPPESLQELRGGSGHPKQDDPAEAYRTGWLTFQSRSGTEKRSLSPIPPGWESLPVEELATLLDRATRGSPRRPRWADAATPVVTVHSPAEDVCEPGPVRAFVYPGGRAWTVCVVTPEQGGPPVLRFTSAGRSLDLASWPPNWENLTDDALIILLRRVPRTGPAPGPGTARRRWNDPRPEGPVR
jgi:hypothetical protein